MSFTHSTVLYWRVCTNYLLINVECSPWTHCIVLGVVSILNQWLSEDVKYMCCTHSIVLYWRVRTNYLLIHVECSPWTHCIVLCVVSVLNQYLLKDVKYMCCTHSIVLYWRVFTNYLLRRVVFSVDTLYCTVYFIYTKSVLMNVKYSSSAT